MEGEKMDTDQHDSGQSSKPPKETPEERERKMRAQLKMDEEAREKLVKEFTALSKQLELEWNKGKTGRDLAQVGTFLDQAKLLIANLDATLSKGGNKLQDLVNIRTVLEIGAFYSLEMATPDTEQFVRYTSQLKNYYLDYSEILKDSTNKFELYCGRLLWLLTENRVSEFHFELALILYPPDHVKSIQHNNPILFKTMKIAESLEDGRYNAFGHKTVFKYGPGGPTPDQTLEKLGDDAIHASNVCKYFLSKLIISYRPDIAETLERGYDRWPKAFAMERLHFKTVDELKKFANERRWVCADGEHYTYDGRKQAESVPALSLIGQALSYAKDLEQII